MSQNHQQTVTISLKPPSDYSEMQYHIVKYGTVNGTMTLCGADEKAVGVLQDKPNSSSVPGLVVLEGTTKVYMATTIAKDAIVYSDSSGHGTSSGSTNHIGKAMEASTAAGDIIEVQLVPKV